MMLKSFVDARLENADARELVPECADVARQCPILRLLEMGDLTELVAGVVDLSRKCSSRRDSTCSGQNPTPSPAGPDRDNGRTLGPENDVALNRDVDCGERCVTPHGYRSLPSLVQGVERAVVAS